jgi:hypothetical protein
MEDDRPALSTVPRQEDEGVQAGAVTHRHHGLEAARVGPVINDLHSASRLSRWVLLRVEVEFASDRRQRVGDDDDMERVEKEACRRNDNNEEHRTADRVRSIAPPMISALSVRFSGMALPFLFGSS